MKYRATQKLLDAISKGEFKDYGIKEIRYGTPHYECLIDINKDWTLRLVINEDAIKNNPDFFKEVKDGS